MEKVSTTGGRGAGSGFCHYRGVVGNIVANDKEYFWLITTAITATTSRQLGFFGNQKFCRDVSQSHHAHIVDLDEDKAMKVVNLLL